MQFIGFYFLFNCHPTLVFLLFFNFFLQNARSFFPFCTYKKYNQSTPIEVTTKKNQTFITIAIYYIMDALNIFRMDIKIHRSFSFIFQVCFCFVIILFFFYLFFCFCFSFFSSLDKNQPCKKTLICTKPR